MSSNQMSILDLLKFPIRTDKATRLEEQNQYSFLVDASADKNSIKLAIEQFFDVKVQAINTCIQPNKKRRLRRAHLIKSKIKKVFVKLSPGYEILFYK